MICNSCNMAVWDLPDMYAKARGLQAYISGKSPMPMLQLLHRCSSLSKSILSSMLLAIHNI